LTAVYIRLFLFSCLLFHLQIGGGGAEFLFVDLRFDEEGEEEEEEEEETEAEVGVASDGIFGAWRLGCCGIISVLLSQRLFSLVILSKDSFNFLKKIDLHT